MLHYIIRRLLLSIPLLIGITVITFLIIHLTPGSPVVLQTSMNAKVSAETQDRLKKLYGLDKPIPVQYVLWIKRLVTGDFGDSFVDMRPVSEKILERLPATLELNILSLLIIFGVAVPLGIYSASRSDTLPDKIFTVGTFASYSLPSFWLGLLIMLIFGLRLNWLPISGMNDMNAEYLPFFPRLLGHLHHLIAPLFVSSFNGFASISRYTRSSMLEVLRQDYIRTARAKGLPSSLVLGKHALRNALLPIITIVGLTIPGLIGGSFIIETIFAWPGLGRLGFESAMSFDYPVIMAVATVGAVLTLLGNLIADILYAWADPRIRFGKAGS